MSFKIYLKNNYDNKLKNFTKNYLPKENGGLLFGRMNPSWVYIDKICDSPIIDKRTSRNIILNNDYLKRITELNIKNNLYIVGTWHSHPNNGCVPSSQDKKTMRLLKKYYPGNLNPIFCISTIRNIELNYKFYTVNNNLNIELIERVIKESN